VTTFNAVVLEESCYPWGPIYKSLSLDHKVLENCQGLPHSANSPLSREVHKFGYHHHTWGYSEECLDINVGSISYSTHQFHSNSASYRITFFHAFTVAYVPQIGGSNWGTLKIFLARSVPQLYMCYAAPDCSSVVENKLRPISTVWSCFSRKLNLQAPAARITYCIIELSSASGGLSPL